MGRRGLLGFLKGGVIQFLVLLIFIVLLDFLLVSVSPVGPIGSCVDGVVMSRRRVTTLRDC